MDYNFEALGDERFQKVCQALLTASFPNVQCLPVGQPDGGRDAFARLEGGFLVFQVKYSKNPALKEQRMAIADLIRSEKPKVDLLIKKGAAAYYLMTNVAGTAHLDVGSIDTIDAILTKAFGIPSFCWWRDDIERRVETVPGLIWRYPDMMRGSDFLEIVLSGKTDNLPKAKLSTFRAYLAAQYSKDSEVRFRQVQIQNSLLDLFTDTPIGAARDKIPPPKISNIEAELFSKLTLSINQRRYQHFFDDGMEVLAADWLLQAAPETGLQRIVLEGAPGQGKSTVTQYVAQLHRMRMLRKEAEAGKVPANHLDHLVRFPMRVDLRDYATWLTGYDPFAAEKEGLRPAGGVDGIESFLAHHIYTLSGGREFTVDDLSSTLSGNHCLLILDGFDEVADKTTRTRLIEQIRAGSERLGEDTKSIQVIVTSRPAAFILSPGFSEREWVHLALLPMQLHQIGQYTDKWLAARSFPPNEVREFKTLVLDRVSRAHIRSLAQNPMQLAILLNLISTKGRSLPDKRTALYDSYMDLFFGREAEKDETVRENRDLLIQIHQFVAWILQVDAERPGGSGSITQNGLEELVRKFLLEKEHTADVLKLFTGAVERVGALVSRVQGTLEFEVQPLREYFAGRFLYETAPYSPPGAEKGGTRPQRFDALARRPYWLNVARFYAGCYNSGELSSLISGLEALEEGADLTLRSHALQLAVLLLNDWVFSQEPKTVRDVVDFLTRDVNFRVLVASRSTWDEDRLRLPEKCGRKEISSKVRAKFIEVEDHVYLNRLGLVLRLNMPFGERWALWENLRSCGKEAFSHACALGLFHESGGHQRRLIETYGEAALHTLISFGHWSSLTADDHLVAVQTIASKSPSISHLQRGEHNEEPDKELYRLYIMLNPYLYIFLSYDASSEQPLEKVLLRYGIYLPEPSPEPAAQEETNLYDVISAANRSIRSSVLQWRTTIEPWSDFVEAARRTWGDSSRLYCLAAIGAGIKSKSVRAAGFDNLLDITHPLVERARHARLRPSVKWWKKHLAEARPGNETIWVLTLLITWAPGGVLTALKGPISRALDGLSEAQWRDIILNVRAVLVATSDSKRSVTGLHDNGAMSLPSARFRALLTLRLPRLLAQKVLLKLLEEFDGNDRNLGAFLATRGMWEARREPKMWKDLIRFFARVKGAQTFTEFDQAFSSERHYYAGHGSMSLSLAGEVAENGDSLPLRMLEVAEITASRAGRGSVPLGSLADQSGWFS